MEFLGQYNLDVPFYILQLFACNACWVIFHDFCPLLTFMSVLVNKNKLAITHTIAIKLKENITMYLVTECFQDWDCFSLKLGKK